MKSFKDLNRRKKNTPPKEEFKGDPIGMGFSGLGLEVVEVTEDRGHTQYICRPRAIRELILTRVAALLGTKSMRIWQEWILSEGQMVVAIVVDVPNTTGLVKILNKVAQDTLYSPKEFEVPIKLDNRPKVPFDLSNSKDKPGMAGADYATISGI